MDKKRKVRKKMSNHNEIVADWYTDHWEPGFKQWWKGYETLGLHEALYEKNTKNFEEGLLNMNNFVGRLLGLKEKQSAKILDAGCGVGGTSIYLGNKFKNVQFTGITITPKQVIWANKFAAERNFNRNVNFLLKSYLDTGFPDGYFDAAFALESVSYAINKRAFTKEMSRILKTGGRLVVIAPTILKPDMNEWMKRIYELDYLGRGDPIFPILEELKTYLKEEEFKQIETINLSKNIYRSEVRSFILSIPFMFSVFAKSIFNRRKYDPSKDIDYYLAVGFLSPIMGLSGTAGYYAITAIKK